MPSRFLLGRARSWGRAVDWANPGLAMTAGCCSVPTWKCHVLAQGAGDSASFSVEIEHRGFEVIMAKHDLQIAHKGATVEGVRSVSMAQIMRRDPLQVTSASSLFDGALDIVFMATPAHLGAGARVAASEIIAADTGWTRWC